ncbi:uncharacterized protein LOC120010239 isoform X2 [Tripterygium wilfordii]|uniref:uncharacterized protein LOC120010239 isoform X2 n=1 Tax=Tripterygium wilfordii TaxID=458696 RepID=UPI0018F80290|nr:uncharacterized protein LOC120010239 isoform X2 [Tripterygium wilfordii]
MDLSEVWAIFGPAVAGAVFGAGWWFWIDAVVCSSVTVSFVHYLPGIFASIAAVMFNCVRKEDIDYSPYDEGEWSKYPTRQRLSLRTKVEVKLKLQLKSKISSSKLEINWIWNTAINSGGF